MEQKLHFAGFTPNPESTLPDELAAQLDEVQYANSDGPCMQAMRTGEVTLVSDFATEQRWDAYPAHALSYGVRSALSLPLNADGNTPGALNLYARTPNAAGAGERENQNRKLRDVAADLVRSVTGSDPIPPQFNDPS